MTAAIRKEEAAPERGRLFNSGDGPTFQVLDIGHDAYLALIDPDTAFWSLVRKERLADAFAGDGDLMTAYRAKAAGFAAEMETLRFRLKPSAVYFNPTERCNLDCAYCYIPGDMRSSGRHMKAREVISALERLDRYFARLMPEDRQPKVIFHGAEPLLNRDAIFAGIEGFGDRFRFGIQTNGTLLDDEAVAFLGRRNVGIGLSLDGPDPEVSDRTRATWGGKGIHGAVVAAMERLRGYRNWSVICTITDRNVTRLSEMVDLFHAHEAPACMLNAIRCTLPGARGIMADDALAARHYIAALERSHFLFRETGRKMVVANFANILLAILAPTARRLMCDISPCGGGRAFFALAPDGGLFPCSEFIGLPDFQGGNLFDGGLETMLDSPAFRLVTERRVENIDPCRRCAIRHFCGAPCPAEACETRGGMDRIGAYCAFYEEQARYAFRLIADGRADDFLWDGWAEGTEATFDASTG
jgi:uncharacterized protein